jgi:hypothetical protein
MSSKSNCPHSWLKLVVPDSGTKQELRSHSFSSPIPPYAGWIITNESSFRCRISFDDENFLSHRNCSFGRIRRLGGESTESGSAGKATRKSAGCYCLGAHVLSLTASLHKQQLHWHGLVTESQNLLKCRGREIHMIESSTDTGRTGSPVGGGLGLVPDDRNTPPAGYCRSEQLLC